MILQYTAPVYDVGVKKPKSCDGKDSLLAGPQLPNGFHPFVRHRAGHSIQQGYMRPVAEGEPLLDGAFCLEQRGESNVYDVRDEFVMPKTEAKGPAKVNSAKFRKGWDSIFGKLETPEA